MKINSYTKELGDDETIPIWFDKHFKLLFGDKNHLDRTKYLISCVLNKEIDEIEFIDNELIEDNRIDKINTVDLVARFDCEYVSIEANSSFGDIIKNRNLAFLFRIQSRQLKSGEDYTKLKKHYQINLNQESFDDEPINVCHIRSDNSGKLYSNLFEIHNINVKYFVEIADKCYNKNVSELSLREKLFALIGTNKKSVIDRITQDNTILKEIGEMAKKYSGEKHLLNIYNREELLKADMEHEFEKKQDLLKADMEHEFEKKSAKKVSEAKKDNTIDIAKKMKKEKIDINLISKVTNLSLEDISKL